MDPVLPDCVGGAAVEAPPEPPDGRARLRVGVYGAVQGVGFRPFVYRLARKMGLCGSVLNSPSGVVIEIEGDGAALDGFMTRLREEKPAPARIDALEIFRLRPCGYRTFNILPSERGAGRTATVLPDLATCGACVREILNPADRRFGYAFTNCTHCGPRWTIQRDIPYDRPGTTMAGFSMCDSCRREYEDPSDRRFHAQPNACSQCGPSLEFADRAGRAAPGEPLSASAAVLRAGGILAVKGIGGFHLMVDARQSAAIARLRALKARHEKPFAVMFPSLDCLRAHAEVGAMEARLLQSPAAPIVLLRRADRAATGASVAQNVSMSSPYLGVMLPYSPLHHLLMAACAFPVVATSGNRGEEPIAKDNDEALSRLGGIADAFLWHDRPIARSCDDSVVRVARAGETIQRRARGYAPLPVRVRHPMRRVLAVGAHQKNTVAICVGREVFMSQHVGDLETLPARDAFKRAIDDLCALYAFTPEIVACDLHPDYFPTRHAESLGLPLVRIQHHHAHLAACAADNDLGDPYLGIAWDGSGFGLDGTVWGGEFFLCDEGGFRRVARLRPFKLPGGDSAVREGRRVAYGLLREAFGGQAPPLLGLTQKEEQAFASLIERGVNCPAASSAGRLFDAVAAIAGIAMESRFEGQAAMLLEAAIPGVFCPEAYPAPLEEGALIDLDWRPLIRAAAGDAMRDVSPEYIAARFHNALVEWIVEVARRAGRERVVMSGGVFQNAYLTERACRRLEQEGFTVFTHHRVPPNDGGIALGQAVLAL